METPKSVEDQKIAQEGNPEVSENIEKHDTLAFINLNLFDEDMVLIKKHKINGREPVNFIDLSDVHFLTIEFITRSQLKQEYTEKELENIVNEMFEYKGIGLRFYSSYTAEIPYNPRRVMYTDTSKKSPLNVYKYGCLKYHLVNRYSIFSQNINRGSENDWYKSDSCSDIESLQFTDSDGSMSAIDDEDDDDDCEYDDDDDHNE